MKDDFIYSFVNQGNIDIDFTPLFNSLPENAPPNHSKNSNLTGALPSVQLPYPPDKLASLTVIWIHE